MRRCRHGRCRDHGLHGMGDRFLFVIATSNKKHISHGARQQLEHIFNMVTEPIPVLRSGGEELPACTARKGTCVHVSNTQRLLQNQCGSSWVSAALVFFEISQRYKQNCPAVAAWTYQVFWQCVEMLDASAVSNNSSCSAEGLAVLRGPKRCRRLTKIWLTAGELGVDRHGVHGYRLSKNMPRDKSAMRKEELEMGKYLANLGCVMSGVKHLAISMDASSACGKDNLSMAAYIPRDHKACWLPLQDG